METKKINYIDWWKQTPSDVKSDSRKSRAYAPVKTGTPTFAENEQTQPVAPVSSATPYVQPLVIVPYLSPDQPMYYYDKSKIEQDDDRDDTKFYEDMFDDEESGVLPEETVKKPKKVTQKGKKGTAIDDIEDEENTVKKKKANVCAIFTAIFGLIYIAMEFDLTKLVKAFNYNVLYDGKVGFVVIEELVKSVIGKSFAFSVDATLLPVLVTVGALFIVLTTVLSLISVASRTSVVTKIVATLALAINAAAAVVAFAVNKIPFETYGLIILAGISLAIFLLTILAKGKKGAKRKRGGKEN